jgi:amidase
MADLPFQSAVRLAAAIRDRRIGCRELLESYLNRIDRFNPAVNAVVVTDLPAARERADAADRALARGEVWGPLHGVPVTVKEAYDVVGMPTTWGVPELRENFPRRNAHAVDRLLAAGVTLFGKTNVPRMLSDWQTFNAIHGTTNNPWDLGRVPGGSSGGAAAALAAGLTGLEAGSDVGGSIRMPAHYCGVWGHKPTYGIVSPRGQALPNTYAPSDIGVVGPMARSAEDLAVALDAMAGADGIDGMGWRLDLPPPRRRRLAEYRVALMLSDPGSEVDREIKDCLQTLGDFLARSGAHVSDTARPGFDTREAGRVFIELFRAATSGRLSAPAYVQELAVCRGLEPGDDSYLARAARGNTMRHRDWLAADQARHRMGLQWAAFFADYDVLLCPAAASAAFPHSQAGELYQRTLDVNGGKVAFTDQLFWAGFSGAFYLPSTVAPAGQTQAGLPIGVQIVGPRYGDRTTIDFAAHLERGFRGFVPPPGYA